MFLYLFKNYMDTSPLAYIKYRAKVHPKAQIFKRSLRKMSIYNENSNVVIWFQWSNTIGHVRGWLSDSDICNANQLTCVYIFSRCSMTRKWRRRAMVWHTRPTDRWRWTAMRTAARSWPTATTCATARGSSSTWRRSGYNTTRDDGEFRGTRDFLAN